LFHIFPDVHYISLADLGEGPLSFFR
jgi:hypothetical protein